MISRNTPPVRSQKHPAQLFATSLAAYCGSPCPRTYATGGVGRVGFVRRHAFRAVDCPQLV